MDQDTPGLSVMCVAITPHLDWGFSLHMAFLQETKQGKLSKILLPSQHRSRAACREGGSGAASATKPDTAGDCLQAKNPVSAPGGSGREKRSCKDWGPGFAARTDLSRGTKQSGVIICISYT